MHQPIKKPINIGRGEGGGDVDGRAFMVARRSPLRGLDTTVATRSPTLGETRRLTILSFLLLLGLMPITAENER